MKDQKRYFSKRNSLRLSLIMILTVFGLCQQAQAQINVIPWGGSHPRKMDGIITLGCAECEHPIDVQYNVTQDMVTDGTVTYVGVWLTITNLETGPEACTASFVSCSMVQFAPPLRDEAEHAYPPRTTDLDVEVRDSKNSAYYAAPFLGMDMNTSAPDPPEHPNCFYICTLQTEPIPMPYWAYTFGCKGMELDPGETGTVFDGWYEVTSVPEARLVMDGLWVDEDLSTDDPTNFGDMPPLTKPIRLSQDVPLPSDDPNAPGVTTWNVSAMYTDIIQGCDLDESCNITPQPNFEYGIPADVPPDCLLNDWTQNQELLGAPPPGGGLEGRAATPIGNNWTMQHMDSVYPARFAGSIANAPAGTKLKIWAPVDTMHMMPVYDTGYIYVPGIAGCEGDTLGFEFPFLVTGMGSMYFKLEIPAGCSALPNGHEIKLIGDVFARTTSALYDSGAFMYWNKLNWQLDSTSPQIISYNLRELDPTHLEIQLTGVEDVSMVTHGFVKYRVNGGPEQLLVLQYENMRGDTAAFIDTLVSPIPFAQIILRGYVGNMHGDDSTAIDTCQLIIAPSKVNEGVPTFKFLSVLPDKDSRIVAAEFITQGESLSFSLVTEDGKVIKLTSNSYYDSGTHRISLELPGLSSGPYFFVARNVERSYMQRVVL